MGERTAISLKLLNSSMGFPGMCRGIKRPISLCSRFLHCLNESLWCEWDMSVPKGPDGVSGLALYSIWAHRYIVILFCVSYRFFHCVTLKHSALYFRFSSVFFCPLELFFEFHLPFKKTLLLRWENLQSLFNSSLCDMSANRCVYGFP